MFGLISQREGRAWKVIDSRATCPPTLSKAFFPARSFLVARGFTPHPGVVKKGAGPENV